MLSTTTNKIQYIAGGASPDFNVTFAYYNQTHLQIYQNGVLKTVGTDYTVLPTTNTPTGIIGGVVHFIVTPPVNDVILIIRVVPSTQLVDLKDLSTLPADQIEAALDLAVMRLQQRDDDLLRTLQYPITSTASAVVPDPGIVANRGKALFTKGDGTGLELQVVQAGSFTNPITTKGDLLGFSTVPARVPVGLDGTVLIADSIAALGVSWVSPAIANPIINGNMEIWQRGILKTPNNNGDYLADQWEYEQFNTSVVDARRSVNVPTVAQSGIKFNFSLEIDVTVADVSVAAADTSSIRQGIEGFNWSHFHQKPFVVTFWVMSPKTGTHSLGLRAGSNFIAGVYTVNSANTWERKQVAFPASPSGGGQAFDEQVGLTLRFVLMAGSDFHSGTPGVWTTNFGQYASASQVNCVDNVANFFRITGVRMDVGVAVSSPVHFENHADNLQYCQRHYQKSFDYDTTPATNAGTTGAEYARSPLTGTGGLFYHVDFPVLMRVAPTIVTYNPLAANSQSRNIDDAADDGSTSPNAVSHRAFAITFVPNAANTIGDQHQVHWTADASVGFI